MERDEYVDGTNLSARLLYNAQVVTAGGGPGLEAIVKFEDAAGTVLREEDHYFYGNPQSTAAPPAVNTYADWWQGLEYQTDIKQGTTVLASTFNVYQQRPWGTDETNQWFSTSVDAEPAHDPQLCQVTTTVSGSATSGILNIYDRYNNRREIYEFDFGHAPAAGVTCTATTSGAARHTFVDYGAAANATTGVLSLPTQTTVMDGSENAYSRLTNSYDSHGNLLKTVTCYSSATAFSPPAACTSAGTSYSYDSYGNVLTVTDARNKQTSISYADSQNTYARPIRVTNAMNQSMQIAYDFNTGKPTLVTDLNGVGTAYSYNDGLDRLTQTVRAQGSSAQSQTNYQYPTTTEADSYQEQKQNGDQALRTQTFYDGFGRQTETRQYESASGYISTTQSYDALGRILATTNPARAGDGLAFSTSYSYDSLGRSIKVQTADSAFTTSAYSADSGAAYTLAKDEAGHQRKYSYNGLRQLAGVSEDPSSLNYLTSYGYDPLNNLILVTQGSQTRTFHYDSWARLTSAANPENGTVAYTYDNGSNLITRTDTANRVTCYGAWSGSSCDGSQGYDALNRLLKVTYSDGVTPAVAYSYDASNVANGIGHLASMSNTNSTQSYLRYDPLGRVLSSSQTTNGKIYLFSYAYNLAGALTGETYPSGRTISNGYDAANRAAWLQGVKGGATTNYIGDPSNSANWIHYWPHGGLYYFPRGNTVWHVENYNSRLQVSESYESINNTNDAAHKLLISCANWGASSTYQVTGKCSNANTANDNGNLQGYTAFIGNPGATSYLSFAQTLAHDNLNRLKSVSDGGGWSRSFSYDRYGNMCVSANSGVTLAGNTPACPNGEQLFGSNNRLTSGTYDGNGNQTAVNGNTLTYDSENRVTKVVESSGTETLAYDGSGQRVIKTQPSGTSVFAYDAFGQLAAEYNTATQTPACTTCYVGWDHLRSTRLLMNQSGAVVARHDYLPFGEEVPASTAGRTAAWGLSTHVAQKFTGQERDAETGLDYFGARYYGSVLGRFTSPDEPIEDQNAADPQSWNLYGYVQNNPLSNVDPSGQDCIAISNQSSSSVTVTTVRGGSADTCSGTYVDGTVNVNSYSYNGGSLSWSDNSANTGGAIDFFLSFSMSDNTDWSPGSSNMAGAAKIGSNAPFANGLTYLLLNFLSAGMGNMKGPGPEVSLGRIDPSRVRFGNNPNQDYHTFPMWKRLALVSSG